MTDEAQLHALQARLEKLNLLWWKEEAPLQGEPYTVMHIESVIDLLDFLIDAAVTFEDARLAVLTNDLKTAIMVSIGREVEDEN